jgi:outer membrane biosynthesis protein TonB
MNTANDLVFRWEKPGRGKWTLSGFLLGSLAIHAFGFYLFQIVYPPAIALLPPPGRVSLIAPNSDEGRQLLRWIEAEDPALASTTLPAPDAKGLVMPTIQHAPSYLGRQPALKDLPPAPVNERIPSAHPPAPVEKSVAATPLVTRPVATMIRFSPQFVSLISPQTPELKFTTSSREAPEAARFAIGVNDKGEVRHCFLQSSSGDPALDEQARKYIAASRIPAVRNSPDSTPDSLVWGNATVEWGNDIATTAPSSAPATP